MTPPARIAAAIAILDQIIGGQPAELTLTRWARTNRYAGSGDRAAIRDHVYDALRRRRSYARLGGAETGRGMMLGALRQQGTDPETIFMGEGYAPAALTDTERTHVPGGLSEAEALDVPDWLMPALRDSLGDKLAPILRAMQARAPVCLRVNTAKATVPQAIAALAADGITVAAQPLAATSLEVVGNARRVAASQAYRDGLVELQDAASQAVIQCLAPVGKTNRVLDYCAGGGGKTLALAALAPGAAITAHDANSKRMADLPARAKRAGAQIEVATGESQLVEGTYDLVLCDVPCSGSGAWRRDPAGKWMLTPAQLARLEATQATILQTATRFVAPKGRLAYVTCSLLRSENTAQIDRFLEQSTGWRCTQTVRLTPLDGGDGFFLAELTREPQ